MRLRPAGERLALDLGVVARVDGEGLRVDLKRGERPGDVVHAGEGRDLTDEVRVSNLGVGLALDQEDRTLRPA